MISHRCQYALRAMLELSRQESQGGRVTIADIARQQDIPTRFLEAILRQLKQAGLTESLRGKEGGYQLARPAHSITVGEVIRIFESSICPQRDENSNKDVFFDIWKKADDALNEVYDQTDFSTLAEKDRIRREGFSGNYSI